MTLILSDCEKLKAQIEEIEDRIHAHALGESPRQIQTGTENTVFNSFNLTAAKQQLARLTKRYNSGGCAVTLAPLGETTRPTRALKPYIGY